MKQSEKAFSKVLNFRVSNEELYTTFEKLRKQSKQTRSNLLQEILEDWVEKNKKFDLQNDLFDTSKK